MTPKAPAKRIVNATPAEPVRDADYWMGALAMSLSLIAAGHPDPRRYAGERVQAVLRDRYADPELKQMLRTTLKEKN